MRQIEAKAVAKLQHPVRSRYLEAFVPGAAMRRADRGRGLSRIRLQHVKSAKFSTTAGRPGDRLFLLALTSKLKEETNRYRPPPVPAASHSYTSLTSSKHQGGTRWQLPPQRCVSCIIFISSLTDLRDRVERGPKQIRAREANVAQLKAKVDEARARVQETQMAINRKQLDLKAGEQKVVDAKVKLNAASSNKEYQALVEQIAAAEMAGSVLADEILESMEKIDALQLRRERSRRRARRRQSGTREDAAGHRGVGRLASRPTSRGSRRASCRPKRRCPADFKVDYQRVVRGKGANGLASVDDDVCGGCGQQITLNMQNELRLARPVFCKSCGCLLYLSE